MLFDSDHPTIKGMAAIKQLLGPLFAGASIFGLSFPMFVDPNMIGCSTPDHTEIGARLCKIFHTVGPLVFALSAQADEFIAIEKLVLEQTEQLKRPS